MKRKKSTQKKKLICPCCKAEVYDSGMSRTIGRKVWIWGTTRQLEREDLEQGGYQLACDGCLDSGSAILANPQAQLYCDFDPYLAYFDIEKICEECNASYIFRKEEQQYWYENLKFWVQSKPKHCLQCRHELREERKLHAELSALLNDKDKLTISDMERLSELYVEINRPDKSNYYKNLIKKQKLSKQG